MFSKLVYPKANYVLECYIGNSPIKPEGTSGIVGLISWIKWFFAYIKYEWRKYYWTKYFKNNRMNEGEVLKRYYELTGKGAR